jgi:asparagine synthetase B (glutamine-hydrolysing)
VAAGLHISADEATLHTDALGIQDLYTRRVGEAIYFSVRIDPLLRLTDAKLHTDWTAWASIYAFTSPLSDATPFTEVRRMTAATAWVAAEHGLRPSRFEPRWLATEPDGTVSPRDALKAVDDCVPAGGDLAVTLSGGWDSRLLAILARRRSDHVVAWTTSGDDGRDRDIDLAGPVADALALDHQTVVPGPDAWHEELTPVRRRFDFQTTHHVWFMPLARAVYERPERFLDGLAGDTLFKAGRFERKVQAGAEAQDDHHRLFWKALAENRLKDPDRLAPGVAAQFEARSRESLIEAISPFDGHSAATTLSVLHTRTTRAIAMSPLRLLTPTVHIGLPFVSPDVIDAALRVPVADKLGGAFYREMLIAADSRVARLPSTNDGGRKGKRGPRRQTTPAALRAMTQTIRSSETVVGLLGPEFCRALDDVDTLHRLGHTVQGHRVLNWASLFAEWRSTYADVLADDDGPT